MHFLSGSKEIILDCFKSPLARSPLSIYFLVLKVKLKSLIFKFAFSFWSSFFAVLFFWLKTFSEIDYTNIVSSPMQWCERTINGQQKYTFKARGNLRQTPLNTLIHKKRNRGIVGVTFNSSSEFGFKDWSSSKYQNPIPWSNNWNWISKERKHFCLFSFQNLLINLIDLWNFAAILTLWKDLL